MHFETGFRFKPCFDKLAVFYKSRVYKPLTTTERVLFFISGVAAKRDSLEITLQQSQVYKGLPG